MLLETVNTFVMCVSASFIVVLLMRYVYPFAYLHWLTLSAQWAIQHIRALKARIREHIKAQYTSAEWEQAKHRFEDPVV